MEIDAMKLMKFLWSLAPAILVIGVIYLVESPAPARTLTLNESLQFGSLKVIPKTNEDWQKVNLYVTNLTNDVQECCFLITFKKNEAKLDRTWTCAVFNPNEPKRIDLPLMDDDVSSYNKVIYDVRSCLDKTTNIRVGGG
jgi:hypothetical protein